MSNFETLNTVFTQFQKAKSKELVCGIDALVENKNPVLKEPCQSLVSHSEMSTLSPNSTKLYVRFCPSISIEKIRLVQMHLEKTYSLNCDICQWSLPLRLDIWL